MQAAWLRGCPLSPGWCTSGATDVHTQTARRVRCACCPGPPSGDTAVSFKCSPGDAQYEAASSPDPEQTRQSFTLYSSTCLILLQLDFCFFVFLKKKTRRCLGGSVLEAWVRDRVGPSGRGILRHGRRWHHAHVCLHVSGWPAILPCLGSQTPAAPSPPKDGAGEVGEWCVQKPSSQLHSRFTVGFAVGFSPASSWLPSAGAERGPPSGFQRGHPRLPSSA